MGDDWDLDEASEFLIIAATLLDLKAARLLPAAQVEDEEDLALLEARDLLFARLLQYKAFKEAAAHIAVMETAGARRYPRAVALEPRYADALPDLVLGIGPERLLRLAIKALTPKPVPVVSIAHVHDVKVSVREHAALLRDRLRVAGTATFRVLCADCQSTLEVVARFLALLELYREGLVGFAQVQALGELTVRWTGGDDVGGDLEIDEYAGSPDAAAAPSSSPSESDAEAGPSPSDGAASSSPPSLSDAAALPSSLASSDAVAASSSSSLPSGAAASPSSDAEPSSPPSDSAALPTSLSSSDAVALPSSLSSSGVVASDDSGLGASDGVASSSPTSSDAEVSDGPDASDGVTSSSLSSSDAEASDGPASSGDAASGVEIAGSNAGDDVKEPQ
ncbi:hypothetical protein Phou_006660 [Phytohabitans houttuyneae]|uniref:Segregation and condensation protein A n=1 Tax=Phytohabitans houttuyneae TaxID=1076126 RepID=A0A6V8K3E1_9ACTN|nr:hypothetical protein Phou_006660 [Phytohabitans houttuyneae]